jgi:NADPH:quinone reductase-like Zn-dependent oxidoreductase
VVRSADRDQLHVTVGLIKPQILSPVSPTVRNVKATVVTEYGGPDVLKLNEAPVPGPGSGQVSIDVAFTGVNNAEVMARRGHLPLFRPPFVPGLEVAGRIAMEAVDAVLRCEVRVDITDVMPLARARDAHSLLESRRSMGKLLLEVA